MNSKIEKLALAYPKVNIDVFKSEKIKVNKIQIDTSNFSDQINQYHSLNLECERIINSHLSNLDISAITVTQNEMDISKDTVNSLSNSRKQLSQNLNDFENRFGPLCQMSDIQNNIRRLEILNNLAKISKISRQFNTISAKTEKTFIDITLMIYLQSQIYTEISGDLNRLVICKQIQTEVTEKIQQLSKNFPQIIGQYGIQNLTITDILNLILISKSPEQFLAFFNFSEVIFIPIDDHKGVKIEPLLEFHNTFQKLVPILESNQSLCEYKKAYAKAKEKIETEIVTFISNEIERIRREINNNKIYHFDSLQSIDNLIIGKEIDLFLSPKNKDKKDKKIKGLVSEILVMFAANFAEIIKNKTGSRKDLFFDYFAGFSSKVSTYLSSDDIPKNLSMESFIGCFEDSFLTSLMDENNKTQLIFSVLDNLKNFLSPMAANSHVLQFQDAACQMIFESLQIIQHILIDKYSKPGSNGYIEISHSKYYTAFIPENLNIFDVFSSVTDLISIYRQKIAESTGPDIPRFIPDYLLKFYSKEDYTTTLVRAFITNDNQIDEGLITKFKLNESEKEGLLKAINEYSQAQSNAKKSIFSIFPKWH